MREGGRGGTGRGGRSGVVDGHICNVVLREGLVQMEAIEMRMPQFSLSSN